MGLAESWMINGLGMVWVFYAFLWLLPVAYLVLRWRAYRESAPADPQLGLKTALYYFKTVAYQLGLAGMVCLLLGLLSEQMRDSVLRIGASLLLSGGLIYTVHAQLIVRKTNTQTFPAAARLFNGFNLAITGLAGMIAVVSFFVLIFQPGDLGEPLRVVLSALLVYVPAWVAQAWILFRKSEPAAPQKPAQAQG